MKGLRVIAGLFLTGFCFPLAEGAEAVAETRTVQLPCSAISADAHIFGPEVSLDDLKGKVVMIEKFGINCPPCRAAIPELESMWRKYSKSGKFMFIASHCQGRDDAALTKLLKENNATYSVYQFLPAVGLTGRGIPHAGLYDHTGKLVVQGHPTSLIAQIDALIKAAPTLHPVYGAFKPKILATLAGKLAPGKRLDMVIAELKAKSEDGNAALADEAKTLLAASEKYVAKEKAQITSALQSEPSKALTLILAYKKMMPEDTDFNENETALKSSKALKQLMALQKEKLTTEKKVSKLKKPSKALAASCMKLSEKAEKIEDEKLPGIGAEALTLSKEFSDLAESAGGQ